MSHRTVARLATLVFLAVASPASTAVEATRTFLVPIVLSAAGARGSFFTSELTLTNRGPSDARLHFDYTGAFGDGAGSGSDILPQGQKIVPDAIAYLRSIGVPIAAEGNRGGTLRVRFSGLASPADASVTVRTTTAVPEGRAGLAYAGITPSTALGARPLPDDGPLRSVTYRPTDLEGGDAFPAPAPASRGAPALTAFSGSDPNGTWSLYVVDDSPTDTGEIARGWCLEVTTADGATRRSCNTGRIGIPASGTGSRAGAPASPYPASLTVSGLAGPAARVVVTLDGFSHAWPDDVDVLVVGPTGQSTILMSDAGGDLRATDLALDFDDVASTATLCGLRQDAADRSNVAVLHAGEPADGDIVLRTTVHSGSPSSPSIRTLPDETLSPGGFKQYSGILGDLGFSSGYVTVSRVGGTAPWFAYAAINDQGSSDGSYVTPLPAGLGAGKKSLVLPVVVEAGAFSTEIVVANVATPAKTVTLTLVSDNVEGPAGAAAITLTLAAGEQRIFPDFVSHLRASGVAGIPPRGPILAGALFATVDSGDVDGLFLGGRTTSAGEGGRYGVFYTAVPEGLAREEGAWVYGLQQNGENRTNLALVNTGETDGSTDVFRIDLYDGETGRQAGTVDGLSLPPRRWTQLGSVLSRAAPGVGNGFARITRVSGANPFLAYGVLNDGEGPGARSGDGAFVPAEPDCVYALSAGSRTFGWSGATSGVDVAAPTGCDWSASSDAPWLSLSGTAGIGNGGLSYTVAPNAGPVSRTATLGLAGRALTVTQLGDAAGPHDGRYSGTTSQSKPIRFTIAKNELTLLAIGISASLGPCAVTAPNTEVALVPPPVVLLGAFASSLTFDGGATSFVLDLSGAFASPSAASGEAVVPLVATEGSVCVGPAVSATWTAVRDLSGTHARPDHGTGW